MDITKQHHHFLISGNVVFVVNEGTKNEGINSIPLNGVLITDTKDIPVRSLSKAQQTLQIKFLSQMGEDAKKTRIIDVVLHNFVHLGLFTKEEFEQGVKDEITPKENKPSLQLVKTSEVIKDGAAND